MNKHISITREQVDKMLEMCKDSFPEYCNIKFTTRYGTHEVWFDNLPDNLPDPTEFHWFELCVTELPRVILEKLDRYTREDELIKHHDLHGQFQTGGEMLFFATTEGKHIIDLLYKEYKKLKKWQLLVSKV